MLQLLGKYKIDVSGLAKPTTQFRPLTSGIISVPVKTQSMSPKYSFTNATVMMFRERLGTRIGRYTACFVSKKDNIHSCVMCRPAAIAGLPKIVKANTNVLGLAKLSQTKNHMHCCCTKQQFQPLTSGNSSQNSVHLYSSWVQSTVLQIPFYTTVMIHRLGERLGTRLGTLPTFCLIK